MRIERTDELKDGRAVRLRAKGHEVTGVLSSQGGSWYVLHNSVNLSGDRAPNMKGRKYSWHVGYDGAAIYAEYCVEYTDVQPSDLPPNITIERAGNTDYITIQPTGRRVVVTIEEAAE